MGEISEVLWKLSIILKFRKSLQNVYVKLQTQVESRNYIDS